MRMRWPILLFVVAFLLMNPPAFAEEVAPAGEPVAVAAPAESAAGTVEVAAAKTIVYYFYTAARCASCHKIENWGKAAVESAFAAELAAGVMAWRPVNIEEKGNEHFVEEFQLYTKAIVVARMDGGKPGKWKNLDKIWMLLRDEAKYKEYVVGEIKAILN